MTDIQMNGKPLDALAVQVRDGKINYTNIVSFLVVILFYLLTVLLSIFGLADRPLASLVLVGATYLAFRPAAFLHPANFVFVYYLLYLVMPYSLFLVYKIFDIEYILPWGLINDWSLLSFDALYHFEVVFLMFFMSSIYLYKNANRGRLSFDAAPSYATHTFEVSKKWVWFLTGCMLIGCALFLQLTGGAGAWVSNYSEAYLKNKEGVGFLNYTLIIFSHFLAFVAGWMKWRSERNYSAWLWAAVLIALLACIFLQGIKSRIPLVLFFFLLPRLMRARLVLGKSIIWFLFMVLLFLIGMYFRSDGFYGTPRLAIEYLQSYFNTVFLHDLLLNSPPPSEITGSMFRGVYKYQELLGEQVPREKYDLSVALTQHFFPSDWYIDGATQQWPIETDLFVTTDLSMLWLIPIFIYMFFMIGLSRRAVQAKPFFIFVYGAELVRIMSVFRSGLLTWDLPLLVTYYFLIYLVSKAIFVTKVSGVRSRPAHLSSPVPADLPTLSSGNQPDSGAGTSAFGVRAS